METKSKIQVSGTVISEKSIGALVDLLFDEKGECSSASRLIWFPKSICVLEEFAPKENHNFKSYFITAPKWFLDKNNIPYETKEV